MKAIFQMFLPFFIFLFLTIVLFFYLKNDNVIASGSSGMKEIFKDVSVKKSRDKVRSGVSEVTSVRWNQHDGFERLVFDVTDYKTGNFELGVDARDINKLHGTLIGYKHFSATLPNFSASSIVKDMEVYTQGNNGYNFTLILHRSTTYKVFLLQDPTRIVVDLY